MTHRLELKEMADAFRPRFKVDRETVVATEGGASKSSAHNRKALAVPIDAVARAC